jgi:predicted nucleotidyltransferase
VGFVKNPNDIVERYVADYRAAFGNNLISVIMYGSAVTHEYRPRHSDINTLIVLDTCEISDLAKCLGIAGKWLGKKVAIPFFMTKEYIATALDSYPIEFIDMRSNYKVLFGEDVLARFNIKKEHVRLQCERELRGIALHLRREYVRTHNGRVALSLLLAASVKRLLPIFKALLVLNDRQIPKLKSDIIMAVEEQYNLGVSVFTELFGPVSRPLGARPYGELFTTYAKTIDSLIATVNATSYERA